jgi:hypothetical protein
MVKLSRISTDADLMKAHRLHNESHYHDAACLTIIKTLNKPGYFYLEISALYWLDGIVRVALLLVGCRKSAQRKCSGLPER